MKLSDFEAAPSPFLVPFDGSFRVRKAPTRPPRGAPPPGERKKRLKKEVERLDDFQRILYAHDRHSLLLVFQAMDAAGKDSTIRAVMSGIDPAGCQVYSFKQPSPEELDHDFLWRTTCRLPERGRIGIFNRSYYEEVLIVRVHPRLLDAQRLPGNPKPSRLWKGRYESIRDFEKHIARSGTVIVKFWLNVSCDEQRRRFLARIRKPEKNWKFSAADVREREHWDDYMAAYEDALNETSRPWAPWYAIPADDKPYMRLAVAGILNATFESLGLRYPTLDDDGRAKLREMKRILERET